MATKNIAVVNPTMTDVTVNGHTAKANTVTKLALDDTTADAFTFLADGCALVSIDNALFQDREKAGFLMERLQLLTE